MREKSLTQLVEKEQSLYREIQSLDSEMQTLVYENYNKFISATETIRKMSSNFDKMEEELKSLSVNMDGMISGSRTIHNNLKDQRTELNKLSSTYSLLQKLHFMFELCPKMHSFMENKSYNEAVKYYLKAEKALEQYRHFASIRAIDEECRQLLTQLKTSLHQQFADPQVSSQQITETVHLLLSLGEDSMLLAQQFLTFSEKKLQVNASELDYYLKENHKILNGQVTDDAPMDVLEFVDMACNGLLSNLSSVLLTFDSLFLANCKNKDVDMEKNLLSTFVDTHVSAFVDQVMKRIDQEKPPVADPKFLIRALDRFYCRLQSLRKVYSGRDFCKQTRDLVITVVKQQCAACLEFLKTGFSEELMKIRQLIATSNMAENSASQPPVSSLQMLTSIQLSVDEHVKQIVAYLITFRQPDVYFMKDANFENEFTRMIRESVVVQFLYHVIQQMEEFHKTGVQWSSPPQLILILSRVCFDMDASIVTTLLAHVDDILKMKSNVSLTSSTELCSLCKTAAQNLVNHYVRREGFNLSHMSRKSVETRDWMSVVEPRSVRSVMKRMVEDLTVIDGQVGDLYEEGNRVERSSDSSRRTFSTASARQGKQATVSYNNYSSNFIDQSLMSNIQKLFSEKMEIFSAVEFCKLSILTAIVKIALKSLVECVRMCTFSKYGLQQVQVDAFYLQMFLWKFVSDENLIHNLLDEVISSATARCIDPVLMEISVVEKICEGL
jgi:hypothetical protein